MEIGSIVYHVNMGIERFRIRKLYGNIATLDQIDLSITRKINGEMGYKTQICSIENLRVFEENSNQLSLF